MRTGITSLADALVSASVVLTAAIICAGAASADPSQQDQFVALLQQDRFPSSITCLLSSPEPIYLWRTRWRRLGQDRGNRRDERYVRGKSGLPPNFRSG